MVNVEIQLIQWLNRHAPSGYTVTAAESSPSAGSRITVERLSGQRSRHVDVALVGVDVWGERRATIAKDTDTVTELLYEFAEDMDSVGDVYVQSVGYQPYVGTSLFPRYHILVQITSSVGA